MFGTICITALLLVLAGLALCSLRKKKRRGKHACSCGCMGCAMSGMCGEKKQTKKT